MKGWLRKSSLPTPDIAVRHEQAFARGRDQLFVNAAFIVISAVRLENVLDVSWFGQEVRGPKALKFDHVAEPSNIGKRPERIAPKLRHHSKE